jgi:hypothetical protein
MIEPTAAIEPLSEQECERVYSEIRRYLGGTAQENLTRLYITQRELRRPQSERMGHPCIVMVPSIPKSLVRTTNRDLTHYANRA